MASLSAQKKGPDAILAVAHEVLARDSMYRHALAYAVDAYREKNDTANYVSHALRLVSVDIGNATLVENIVQTLAEMHRADVAVPTIDKAIEVSPLEVNLHTLRVLLLISAERWKDAAARSEELLRLDPAAADSLFFVRLSVAYRNDSQPEKSTATLKLATEKFPRNAFFRLLYGQELGRAGQTQEAIAEYKAAIEIDPKLPNVRTFVALAYQQLEQPDSTMAWLRLAHQAKEDSVTIAGMAKAIGGRYLTAAQESKTIEAYMKVIPPFGFADSVSAADDSKWYWAVAEFSVGQLTAIKLQTEPSCELARESIRHLEQAPILIRAGGGKVGGQTAGTIMSSLGDLQGFVNGQITALCRPPQ
jgi:tetratricopeptide (TPR) repeat protein